MGLAKKFLKIKKNIKLSLKIILKKSFMLKIGKNIINKMKMRIYVVFAIIYFAQNDKIYIYVHKINTLNS